MRILVFSQYYKPEPFLLSEICAELVNRRNQVTVITGLPNYPTGVIPEEYKHGKNRSQVIDGVNVIRCDIIPRGKNKIRLMLNYISYMLSATMKSKRLSGNYDVVLLFQLTPIHQAYPAIKYCRKHKLKLVNYCYDLAPKSGSQLLSNRNPLKRLYARFSSWAYRSCDVVAVTSESFINYLATVNKVERDRMVYIPQHASDTLLKLNMLAPDNGIADFMFAGNLGIGANLETIVYAARELAQSERFVVHFVGDGAAKGKIKALISSMKLDEFFVFHGYHTSEEMPSYYKMADALLIVLRPGQITIPGKLQTYMSAGKPVLGAMDGSGADIIKKSKCGLCVGAGNSHALAEVMREFILFPERFCMYGANGREYFIKNFTKDIYMTRLCNVLHEQSKNT